MEQISFDDILTEEESNKTILSPLHNALMELLESNVTSVMDICEHLIKDGLLSADRFSTNKPKAYPKVCSILDELVQKDQVIFVEDRDRIDRIYQLK
ncbi:DUF3895 domain-containing protein [Heyndrickxia oleronia]|uniref:DUF3895 domain-containing protein n=1 Tax=Heyndrickxia oleronia TaxID=38875 RepID=UPI0015D4316E|nr:DUF3895 domain-containing protein [Heyndrickxia oleronia]MCM3454846.1 DUF3895 domain-containing protein [Heyndrickxia oleronia]NYV66590.1 DUF3895 domain-containing protein [Bacillus sp. Gen3]